MSVLLCSLVFRISLLYLSINKSFLTIELLNICWLDYYVFIFLNNLLLLSHYCINRSRFLKTIYLSCIIIISICRLFYYSVLMKCSCSILLWLIYITKWYWFIWWIGLISCILWSLICIILNILVHVVLLLYKFIRGYFISTSIKLIGRYLLLMKPIQHTLLLISL